MPRIFLNQPPCSPGLVGPGEGQLLGLLDHLVVEDDDLIARIDEIVAGGGVQVTDALIVS